MNWGTFIDEESLAQLLPADYSHFALPFKESLARFLNLLPQSIQKQLLAQQLALPAEVSLSVRLGLLATNCPVLQKLGQILARDQRLAPELRSELSKLESLPSTVPLQSIEAILRQELGPLDFKAIELLPPAIAEASVAVIIPFRDNNKPHQPEGVFKVLKPGIEQRLDLELEILTEVGSHLDSRLHDLGIPPLDYQYTFNQVRDKLRCELRLDQEQNHLASADRFFADQPDIVIPALFEHCTPRVTAMQRLFGEKVTDHKFTLSTDKRHLAELVAKALIAQPILYPEKKALFHCDPHAGNLFSTSDGRLGILDWSLAGFLGEQEREALVQVMFAAIKMQPTKIVGILLTLDLRGQCDQVSLHKCVAFWLRKIRQAHLPGLSWLTSLLDDAVQTTKLSLSSDLLMFRKSLLTLSGVLGEIGATGFDLDQTILFEFLRSSMCEWPGRWVSHPCSRSFGTRLSNFDIADIVFCSPFVVGRYWQAIWRDCAVWQAVSINS